MTPVMAPVVSPVTSASLPGGNRTAHDMVEAFEIGAVHAEPLGHGLAVEHSLATDIAHRGVERGLEVLSPLRFA